jgi:hypothetical protein
MSVTLEFMRAPRGAKVEIKVEVTAEMRVTANDARELADEFLLMEVGDLLSAGEPSLRVGDRLAWEVPILLSSASHGTLGEVGRLVVDAETGEIRFTEQDRQEVKASAKALSGSTAPPAGG